MGDRVPQSIFQLFDRDGFSLIDLNAAFFATIAVTCEK